MKFVIVFFMTLVFTQGVAQSFVQKKIEETKSNFPDTTRLKAFHELSNHYLDLNRDSASFFIKHGLILAIKLTENNTKKKINKPILELAAQLFETEGYFHFKEGSLNNSITSFERSLELYSEIDNKEGKANSYNNLAVLFKNIGNTIKSINYNKEAFQLYESMDNKEGVASSLNNLSFIYREQGDIENALKYTQEALQINTAINNRSGMAKSLNALAGLKKTMGDTTEAISFYSKALSVYAELGDKSGESRVLNNIGVIFKQKKNHSEALSYFNRSLSISEQIGYLTGLAFTSINIGELFLEQNREKESVELANEALNIGRNQNNADIIKRSAALLKNAYQKQQLWRKAFEAQALYMETLEEIMNKDAQRFVNQESLRYAYEKEKAIELKEQEQEQVFAQERQSSQRIIIVIIVAIALILALSVVFVFHRLRLSREQNKIISKQSDERKILLQEIHHRVKNNFQIVSSLLRLQSYTVNEPRIKEAFDEAVYRINAMALVHDIIYKQDSFADIKTDEYLRKLTDQLKKTAKNQNVQISVATADFSFQVETLIHIGIIINELVLNSFKYGFDLNSKDPKIDITLTQKKDEYTLTYTENGSGINPTDYKTSFGMELIETVIAQLDGSVEVASEDYWKTKITIFFKEEL